MEYIPSVLQILKDPQIKFFDIQHADLEGQNKVIFNDLKPILYAVKKVKRIFLYNFVPSVTWDLKNKKNVSFDHLECQVV